MAFARVGSSPEPMRAFRWSVADVRPKGGMRSAVIPALSYAIDTTGELEKLPDEDVVLFRDEHGIRPLCPFFELHGRDNQGDGPVTPERLARHGLSLEDLRWSLDHANLKAFVMTGATGDRIEAKLDLAGDSFDRAPLVGWSPEGAVNPLVPRAGRGIAMGALQPVRPSTAFPEVRVRFFAPAGKIFAPTNSQRRIDAVRGDLVTRLTRLLIGRSAGNPAWEDFALAAEDCFLNPQAAWPRHRMLTHENLWKALPRLLRDWRALKALLTRSQLSELLRRLAGPLTDVGKLPPGLYAHVQADGAFLSSLGMVDDMGDGILRCRIGDLCANARIVVCPPDFAPDRRSPVSIADVLADKSGRADVRDETWLGNDDAILEAVDDLLERAFETESMMNLDVINELFREENRSAAGYRGDPPPAGGLKDLLWPDEGLDGIADLPLTQLANFRHRRNSVEAFFEQLALDRPHFIADWIREPHSDKSLYYDRKMPALMRGSDRYPLHLTRRQYEMLKAWADILAK